MVEYTRGRRYLLAAGGAAAGALGGYVGADLRDPAPPATATPDPPESVPTFQYDAARTGAAPGGRGPAGSVGATWRYEAGGPVWSSPAVVDGTVYVGSLDDGLYALDATTGERSWRFETGGNVNPTAAVCDGTVYVGSSDGNLYAVDADAGDGRWRFDAGSAIVSSPAVLDGTLYVGGADGTVTALAGEEAGG